MGRVKALVFYVTQRACLRFCPSSMIVAENIRVAEVLSIRRKITLLLVSVPPVVDIPVDH